MFNLPVPALLEDVVIGPLTKQSSKTKIVFSASDTSETLGHMRWSRDGIHSISEISAFAGDTNTVVDGPCIYGGPIIYHFGHMVAECIHRIWARTAFDYLGDAKVAFQTRFNTELPQWFYPVLKLCGVSQDQVILIDQPTRFRELHVPEQGRLLGGRKRFDAYPSLFPLIEVTPDHSDQKIYVSRSTHLYSGSYFGESYIERCLSSNGYAIIYPEKLPTEALTMKLAGARKIVFAEGSAIHNLELCGKVKAEVFVIGRRNGANGRFRYILDDVCANWMIYDAAPPPLSVFYDKNTKRIAATKGNSFLDLSAVVGMLNKFDADLRLEHDAGLAALCASSDLVRYLSDHRSYSIDTTAEQKGLMLNEIFQHETVKRLFEAQFVKSHQSQDTNIAPGW